MSDNDRAVYTCPLIDVSRYTEISFLRGDPRGSGCPLHETEAMRDERRNAEDLARYGDTQDAPGGGRVSEESGRLQGGPVRPPRKYLYDRAIDGPVSAEPYAEIRHRGGWTYEVYLYTHPDLPIHYTWVGNRWGLKRAKRLAEKALHDHLNPPPAPETIVIRAGDR